MLKAKSHRPRSTDFSEILELDSLSVRRMSAAAVIALTASLISDFAGAESNVYLEAGVPATNREWTGPDYARTSEVLASGNVVLPTYDNEAGKAVLDRLTSTENFALAKEHTIAVEARINDSVMMLTATNALLKQYLALAQKGERVNRELTELLVFVLRNAAVVLTVFDEYAATIPDFDNQPTRVEGRWKIRAGAVTMFSGAEVSLSEAHFYTEEDFSRMLQGMADTFPTFNKAFTPEFREEIRIKLNEDKGRFKKAEDIANVERMLRELDSN